MNLKDWLIGMISNNRTGTETAKATEIGEEDGKAIAQAYVRGFKTGMADVLNSELRVFHAPIEIEATVKGGTPQQPKPGKPRRLN